MTDNIHPSMLPGKDLTTYILGQITNNQNKMLNNLELIKGTIEESLRVLQSKEFNILLSGEYSKEVGISVLPVVDFIRKLEIEYNIYKEKIDAQEDECHLIHAIIREIRDKGIKKDTDDMYKKETKRFFEGKWFDLAISISPIIVNLLLGAVVFWAVHTFIVDQEKKISTFENKALNSIEQKALRKITP